MALSKSSIRLSEKWFQRGLWLVAFVFAGFLIGLGGRIVGDLPRVESVHTLESYIGRDKLDKLDERSRAAQARMTESTSQRQQAQLKLAAAESETVAARETFTNWLATRHVTQRSEQDPEVLRRTQALDALKSKEAPARAEVQRLDAAVLTARQSIEQIERERSALLDGARDGFDEQRRQQELRVFAYRLALTLPLLLVAGWLFKTQRQSRWWPFVWGFIFFALFAFFVELVPYLPSYGGYVRYVVGLVLTVLIGRWVILALQRYLEKQKLAEQQPNAVRREVLGYDVALTRLDKGVCPGCERAVDLKNSAIDFCPHCGIGLFDHCGHCNARKSAFVKFCHACGTPAKLSAAAGDATA